MMIEEVQLLQIIAVFSTRFECVSVESNSSNLTKSMKVLVTHEEKCKMQKKSLGILCSQCGGDIFLKMIPQKSILSTRIMLARNILE